MRNWRNRIFDNLQTLINDSSVDYKVVNDNKLVKDKTIYFQLLDNTETANDLQDNEINAEIYNIQIETYTKVMNDGYNLMDKITNAMKTMSFNKVYGITCLENTIDTNYIRLVARFSRFIGGGDEIEKIST